MAMDVQKMIKELNDLIQLDIDAIHAYDQAISNIDATFVSQQLEGFKSDHQRHVTEVSDVVRRLGGDPPEFKRDFKGFLIQGMTAIRSATGNEGALKAMQTNEKTTNKNYKQAVEMEFPADILQLLQKNYDDERRHLAWIEDAIQRRVWEGAPAQP